MNWSKAFIGVAIGQIGLVLAMNQPSKGVAFLLGFLAATGCFLVRDSLEPSHA